MMTETQSTQRLLSVATPPKTPTGRGDDSLWDDYERMMKLTFPRSYKEFLWHFGYGIFAEWTWVVSPFHPQPRFQGHFQHFRGEVFGYVMSRMYSTQRAPFELPPAVPGLIPFGGDCDGNLLFLLSAKTEAGWKVVAYEAGFRVYAVFDCDVPEFFRRWMLGENDDICPWMHVDDIEGRRRFRVNGVEPAK